MTDGLKMLVVVARHATSASCFGALTHSRGCNSRACIPLASNGFVVSDSRLAQSKEGVIVRVVRALSQGRRAHP